MSTQSKTAATAAKPSKVGAVGNWAERQGLPYAGYTDLAAKPEVYDLIRDDSDRWRSLVSLIGHDVLKDRLYTTPRRGIARRSAQTGSARRHVSIALAGNPSL